MEPKTVFTNFSDKLLKDGLVSNLKDLGLTTKAALTFVTLMFHHQASASTLCRESGIPDSKIYYALNELEKRGMIAIQHGTPNLYKALPPKEAIKNLKRQLTDEQSKKLARADDLISRLEPIYEAKSGSDEVELAYIVKGLGNIIGKMNDFINSAQREVILLISCDRILTDVSKSLIDAKRRGVKVNIAANPELFKTKIVESLGANKLLNCRCCLLIIDSRTLFTVSNWTSNNAYAIMTRDRSLIIMSREYFENPKCCSKIK